MKKLNFLVKYVLVLLTMFIFSCQNDDEHFTTNSEEETTLKVQITTLNKTQIEKEKRLFNKVASLQTNFNLKNSANSTNKDVYNEEYDFIINTNYAKQLYNGINNTFTFPIIRTQDNGLLENLLLVEQEDLTFKVYIVQYNFTEEEKMAINLRQPVDIEDKVTFIEIDDNGLSDDIFGKYYFNGSCYEDQYVYQDGAPCKSGNHVFSDGAWSSTNTGGCQYWGTTDMATFGGNVLTPVLVPCDNTGGGNDGNPPTNPNTNNNSSNPHSSNNGTATTTIITCDRCPEYSEDDDQCPVPDIGLINQLTDYFGEGNFEVDCSLQENEMIDFDSIEDVEDFFNDIFDNNFETSSSEMENILSSLRLDTHSMEFSDFPQADIVASIKVRVPDDNNLLECLEILNVDTNLDGNETLFEWEQLDDTDPNNSNGPLVVVNELQDTLKITIRGAINIGLNFNGNQ